MLALFNVSILFTIVFGFCFVISLIIAVCEDFDKVKVNAIVIISVLLLSLPIIGIIKTCETKEVLEDTYKSELPTP
jgi:hypothetical protein